MNLETIAAVVIWYEPKIDYLLNIASYSSAVTHTYVIDNSSQNHQDWFPLNLSITYIWLGGNFGIAKALNIGCELAYEAGHSYVLTMDQDSIFNDNLVCNHLNEATVLFYDNSVAIVGVAFHNDGIIPLAKYEERESTITSGNLLRLFSWYSIGGFENKLFIDQVDHEFCFRLRRAGYRIIVNSTIVLQHQVGNPIRNNFFGIKIISNNHIWVRRYYQMRNSLYLRKKYPEYVKPLYAYIYDLLYHCLGILIVERDTGKKFKAMFYGALDFFRDRYGSWDEYYQ